MRARTGKRGLLSRLSQRLFEHDSGPVDADASIVPAPTLPPLDLSDMLHHIDWDADPDALRRGDLGLLSPLLVVLLQQAAKVPAVDALAWSAGLDPLVAVIALMAKASARSSRAADRLARNLLDKVDAKAVARAMEAIGLASVSAAP
jgi:hypothetical protein